MFGPTAVKLWPLNCTVKREVRGRTGLTEDSDLIVLADDAAGWRGFPDTARARDTLVSRHVEAAETLELHRAAVVVVHLAVQNGRVGPRARHAGVTAGAMTSLYPLHTQREPIKRQQARVKMVLVW